MEWPPQQPGELVTWSGRHNSEESWLHEWPPQQQGELVTWSDRLNSQESWLH